MDKLTIFARFKRPSKRTIIQWLTPIVLALMVVTVARITIFIDRSQVGLQDFISSNNVQVGSELKDGYGQIYYIFNGKKTFVTDGENSKVAPVTHRDRIAWVELVDGRGQIVTHNLRDHTTTKITHGGTNLTPAVYGDTVAWEKSVNDITQVFYFDGATVKQVSNGMKPSLRPAVTSGALAYARELKKDSWEVIKLDTNTNKEIIAATGDVTNAQPSFNSDGVLQTKYDPFAKLR